MDMNYGAVNGLFIIIILLLSISLYCGHLYNYITYFVWTHFVIIGTLSHLQTMYM